MNNSAVDLLEKKLSKLDSLAVAFSGGIDSAFLLYIGKKVLNDNIMAYTYATPYFPVRDYTDSVSFTNQHSIKHEIITCPIQRQLLSNPIDRCYVCKKHMFSSIIEKAHEHDIKVIADGTLADDSPEKRPGTKALRKLGIVSPLKECGISKEDVRKYAHSENLPLWDKPSNSCYLTRFPFNFDITLKMINMIQEAESLLISYGYDDIRVRYCDGAARIELPYMKWKEFASSRSYEKIISLLTQIGFSTVYAIPKDVCKWGGMV